MGDLRPRRRRAVREPLAAGAGQIGDFSHCSWSVVGTGRFPAGSGASPAIGAVGAVELVTEERVEVIAPSRLRARSSRRCGRPTPTRNPPSTSCASRRCRPVWVSAASASLPARSGSPTSRRWSARPCRGPPGAYARPATRMPPCPGSRCAGCRDSLLGAAAAAGVQASRHRRPVAPSRRRASAAQRRRPGRRRTLGQRVSVVHAGRRGAAVTLRRRAHRCGVPAAHRPWNIEYPRGDHES